MPTFTHRDSGTRESVWLADPRWAAVARLDEEIADVDELIVVAAHPDDETLGAGGLIRRVHQGGGRVTVIVATDGEASHPHSPTHPPATVGALRRVELITALQELAPGARVHLLGLPDGGLRESADALESAVSGVLGTVSDPARALVVAPWSGDGHRDHRIAAECVARAVVARGIRQLGYPIWLWHWGAPDDLPWSTAVVLPLTPAERATKARALDAHATQTGALSDAPGDEPVLTPAMREHFAREGELYIAETSDDAPTLSAAYFDAFYARHDDPWGFETRWYERRKRAVLMAALPSPDLGSVLEIGCSTGLVTAELVPRAARVIAMDASESALAAARARVGSDPRVTFLQAAVPSGWPEGRFDTVVLSEVGYYLSVADLATTIGLIEEALTDDGCLVACHWRHPVAEYPQSGDQVHRLLRGVAAWGTLVRHEEEDFVLEVFCRRPVVSVARREGLA